MSNEAQSEIWQWLIAYATRSIKPTDPVIFHQLAGVQGQLGGVSAACFLLYRPTNQTSSSVHYFIFYTAPILLQQLSRTTQTQRVVLNGRTQGKIDWSSTYKTRYGQNADSTTFVCLQTRRRFDKPENQLFKYLLHHVQFCLSRIPPSLLEWQAWGRPLRSDQNLPLQLGNYFAVLQHRVRTFNIHIYLRDVTLPESISEQHLLAARTSKNELYTTLVDLYQLYQAVAHASDWDRWVDVLNQTLPLPPIADEVRQLLTI